ncbi:hypothetical protein JOY44_19115 [Phormidium sp. CLA17]|uniref:hypothetical protein n=1 Tax=Leptolyngbya sp. Cla-17 TaxID=2803751 RepID=UPI001932CEF8|nr:hypothetical protein [Leptolyngbya sp. Cla-17]MBM0743700.1 hypothetical protein [Leptolyngbya sp. Cla-17]
MNFSSFLRTTSIATAALTCLVAADVRPVFAVQFFTQIDENNALVSFDGVTQTPFTRYLFSGMLEPEVSGTFVIGGLGGFSLPGFRPVDSNASPEVQEAAVRALADRYTFTNFIGSYFAASSPGSDGTIKRIIPRSVIFAKEQLSPGAATDPMPGFGQDFDLRFSNLTPTGVVVFSSGFVLTLSNPANPSECSNATFPFCGTATFDFGIAQTLQNVTSYSVSPASVSPASEAVPEPSEMAGSAIAIGLLGFGWSLKRKSVKPLL